MQWLCGNALGGNGWSGIFMSGAMILFWGGVLAIGYYFLKTLVRGNGHPSSDALRILKERYARGEISEAEFEQMKAKL